MNNIIIVLPDEIIEKIYNYSNIKCHVCLRNLNNYFYKLVNKNYYCSNQCYLFI